MLDYPETSVSYGQESPGRDTAIVSIVSEEEIKLALRVATESYDTLQQSMYRDVMKSTYYADILRGDVSSLIVLLSSFQNKSPCGFAHETRLKVNDIYLTPEKCTYSNGYSGCGHPELNGMLLAIVVTELILQKSHSTIMMNIQMPIYLHASKQDESAGRVYANPKIQKNPDGSIPIHSDVQSLQQLSGEISQGKCTELIGYLLDQYS